MRKFFLPPWVSFLCLSIFLFPFAALAAGQLVEADGFYTVGEGLEENFTVARTRAKLDALGRAAEMAAVYVEKNTAVQNSQLVSSEIRTLAATVLKVKKVDYFPEPVGSTIQYRCHVIAATFDDAELESLLADRVALREALRREQEKDAQIAELNRQMEELKERYKNAQTDEERAAIRLEVKRNEDHFKALQLHEQGTSAVLFQRNPKKAIEILKEAVARDPNYKSSWNNLGLAYKDAGLYEEARKSFQRAIDLDPEDSGVWRNLASVYLAMGDNKEAIKCMEHAISLDPNNSHGYSGMGVIYSKMGEYQSAVANFQKAIELDKNSPYSYSDLGKCYVQMKRYGTAETFFLKAVELRPDYVDAWHDLCLCYYYLDQNQKYFSAVKKLLQLDPSNADAYLMRGQIYENMGKKREAKQDYQKAYELRPNDAQLAKKKRLSENW